ncbi:MAG: hypothetical protein K1W36_04525 [Lachnospiraceae bacterium]
MCYIIDVVAVFGYCSHGSNSITVFTPVDLWSMPYAYRHTRCLNGAQKCAGRIR